MLDGYPGLIIAFLTYLLPTYDEPEIVARIGEVPFSDESTQVQVTSIRETARHGHAEHPIDTLNHLFVPVFFVYTGMLIDIESLPKPVTLPGGTPGLRTMVKNPADLPAWNVRLINRRRTMTSSHRMVASNGTNETEVRKSRFICHLFRVTSEQEARDHIEAVRKEHWNANHNCTAWIIGEKQANQRSSDDGEPSGTAGMPMLEVLRRRELTDTLAIVTRYFGGTMLGAGGLIRAYGSAVSEALDVIGVVERLPLSVVELVADYETAGSLENSIRARDLNLVDVGYDTDVTFELVMPPSDVNEFSTWVQEITNGAIDATIVGERFVELPAPAQPAD